MYGRSVRTRRAAAQRGKATVAGRLRMPLSRRLRGGRIARRTQYASGVAGSTKHIYARASRELALYVPPRRVEPAEMHYLDWTDDPLLFDTTGSIYHINAVGLGNGITERTGSRALMLGVQIRGEAYPGTIAVAALGSVMIVWDISPRGVLPAISDILDSVSTQSFQNAVNRDRFHILYRKDYKFAGNAATGLITNATNYVVDEFVRFQRSSVWTEAASGAIADCKVGALYLVTVGNKARVASPNDIGGIYVVSTRVHFSDNA